MGNQYHGQRHSRLIRPPVPRLPDLPAERLRDGPTPLIDPDPEGDNDYRTATFVWREHPVAGGRPGSVILHANKFTDYDDLASCALAHRSGTDLWTASFRVPAAWRSSYRIGPLPEPVGRLETGRAARVRLMRYAEADPSARRSMIDHRDGSAWSVAEMPLAPEQFWVDAPAAPDRLLNLTVGDLPVWVHLPAAPFRPGPLPLLVLLDGDQWTHQHPIMPTLDRLTESGRLPPSLTVLVGPSGAGRAADLTAFGTYPDRLADAVVPAVLGQARVRELIGGAAPDPATTVVAGQSLGGLAAVHAGWRRPDVFGQVVAQSGSFWWGNDRIEDAREGPGAPGILGEVAGSEGPARPVRFRFQVGSMEWGMPPIARRLRDLLRDKGYDVELEEFCGGHDRACWRGGLSAGLAGAFGSSTGDPLPQRD